MISTIELSNEAIEDTKIDFIDSILFTSREYNYSQVPFYFGWFRLFP